MARINAVDLSQASGKTKELLDAVQSGLGAVPVMFRTLAQSPAALEAYLSFSAAISKGSLSPALREQIALATAQINNCDYCLAAHSALGKKAGLSDQQVSASRRGRSANPKEQAALDFAKTVVIDRGNVSDAQVANLRQAGFSEGAVAEIVAVVAINLFTNYFNHVADTAVDFPKAPALEAPAAKSACACS